jgi:serine/threonine-protein kinase RsbW
MKMESFQKCIDLKIPAEAEYIDIVRLTLYGIASRMGFSFEDIEDIKVAVSEACNNAIIHGYEGADHQNIDVKFASLQDGIQIVVSDQGGSFDYKETAKHVGPIEEDQSISDVKIGELGIYLMQSLMDKIEVKTEAGIGTEVILTKFLKQG